MKDSMAVPLVCNHGCIKGIFILYKFLLLLPCTLVFHLDLGRQWPPETLFAVGSRFIALAAVIVESG